MDPGKLRLNKFKHKKVLHAVVYANFLCGGWLYNFQKVASRNNLTLWCVISLLPEPEENVLEMLKFIRQRMSSPVPENLNKLVFFPELLIRLINSFQRVTKLTAEVYMRDV